MTVHCCHLVFHIYTHSNQCKCNTQTYCRTNKTCTHKRRRPFHVEIDCSSKMAAHHNMLLYQRSTLQSQFSVPRMSSLSGFTYSNVSGQDNLSHTGLVINQLGSPRVEEVGLAPSDQSKRDILLYPQKRILWVQPTPEMLKNRLKSIKNLTNTALRKKGDWGSSKSLLWWTSTEGWKAVPTAPPQWKWQIHLFECNFPKQIQTAAPRQSLSLKYIYGRWTEVLKGCYWKCSFHTWICVLF